MLTIAIVLAGIAGGIWLGTFLYFAAREVCGEVGTMTRSCEPPPHG